MWTAFSQMKRWNRLVFGEAALLLTGNGVWAATGPDHPLGTREWEAYSGPTERGRRAAALLLRTARGAGARILVDDGFVGIRMTGTFYLLTRDEGGPYLTARSSLPLGLRDHGIYRELTGVVESLRDEMGGRRRLNAGENG